MAKNPPFTTALVHEACPYCLSKMNEQIIIPSKLTNKVCNDIDEANGKCIGFSEEPCPDCQKHLDKDFIALIAIDEEKSDGTLKGAYRTGKIAWLKDTAFLQIFDTELPDKTKSLSLVFVENGVIDALNTMTS